MVYIIIIIFNKTNNISLFFNILDYEIPYSSENKQHPKISNLHYSVLKGPGNLYIRFPPIIKKKHITANHNMIGYLAIYSHVPGPSIVI